MIGDTERARDSAFLNIPDDHKYTNLYFAMIAGLCAYGLDPRATLEIASGERRLDRIYELMTSCHYSFHDLSRVQLDLTAPRTPRFNMPFELGLLVGSRMTKGQTNHNWFVLESVKLRLQKSLSDLNGMDPLIHGGTVTGIFRELCNALVKHRNKPEVSPMRKIYRSIKKASPLILERTGAKSPYGARAFRELVVLATEYAERKIPRD